MKNQNQNISRQNINPVSRKTNEEIDEDENGSLIIGGKILDDKSSEPANVQIKDMVKEHNSLNNNNLED